MMGAWRARSEDRLSLSSLFFAFGHFLQFCHKLDGFEENDRFCQFPDIL